MNPMREWVLVYTCVCMCLCNISSMAIKKVKDGRLVLRHRGDNSMGLFDGDTSFVAQQHQQQSGFFNRMASRQKLESKMLASQHLN
mmetsp:Transcript_24806/g.41667  ORF Transcript_24806/g.41667 Transcript_24806/m.41667 type:complete len:86 (+) Transcript_24806:130-387(+)